MRWQTLKLANLRIENPLNFTIGILGGGQLAKMDAQEAKKLSFNIITYDPDPHCPASLITENITGSFNDVEKLKVFNDKVDIVSYELEHINIDTVRQAIPEDKIYPSLDVLEIIQDKLKQKEFFSKKGLPVPFFRKVENIDEIKEILPVVQKARFGGYDGKGVVVLKTEEDLKKAIKAPSYIEELIDIEREIAVMVVRNASKDVRVYPVVDMVFSEDGNLLDYLVAPSDISEDLTKKAQDIAVAAVEALDGVGVFGVEMFLDKKGRILINEVAPRPHNSGHYTIEACETSQFEQHIRVLTNLPLGSSKQVVPAATLNILGEKDAFGEPVYKGLSDVMKIDGVYVHIYGKRKVKPLRKMGHITVIDFDKNRLVEKVHYIKKTLKVLSK